MATAQPRKVLPASPIKTFVLAKGPTVRLKSRNTPIEVAIYASRATWLSGACPLASTSRLSSDTMVSEPAKPSMPSTIL